jgi:hypothetical protein
VIYKAARCYFRVSMVFEGGWRLVILLSVN